MRVNWTLLFLPLTILGASFVPNLTLLAKAVPLDLRMGDVKPRKNPSFSATVSLVSMDYSFFCTGFVIDASFIATAGHCVDSKIGQNVRIYSSSGQDTMVLGTVVGIGSRMDYGLITGDFSNFAPVKADLYNIPSLDKEYKACGNPFGQKKLICTPIKAFENQYFAVKATGILFPGMSGGPVYDPLTNTVIGVNSAVDDGFVLFYPLTGFSATFDIEPR